MHTLENDVIKTDPESVLYLNNKDLENMAKSTKAQIKAVNKFNKEHTTLITVRLNHNQDADILQKLDEVPSKQGYIKKLIRNDIENGSQGKE